MFVVLKKEKGKHQLEVTNDVVEVSYTLASPKIVLMDLNGMLTITATCKNKEDLNTKPNLEDANLFVAVGNPSNASVVALTDDVTYLMIETNTEDQSMIDTIRKKITMYLNEEPQWDGDELTLSRDYEVRISKRFGVLLDCTINM